MMVEGYTETSGWFNGEIVCECGIPTSRLDSEKCGCLSCGAVYVWDERTHEWHTLVKGKSVDGKHKDPR